MAFKKKSVSLTASGSATIALGAPYGKVHEVAVVMSAGGDQAVTVAIADAEGDAVITSGSIDFTLATGTGNIGTGTSTSPTKRQLTSALSVPLAGTQGTTASFGKVVTSPLTVTSGAQTSGTLTVSVYYEI